MNGEKGHQEAAESPQSSNQPRIDMNKFHHLDVVVICGLPRAGKSRFASAYFGGKDRKRINRAEIRKFLYTMMNFGDEWFEKYFKEEDESLVKHVERKIFEHFLHNGRKVLIDNTSVTKSSRKHYVVIAKQMSKSIGTIFLNTSIQLCLERNQTQEDSIPDHVLSGLYAKVELPEREEGFKEWLIVDGNSPAV